MLSRKDFNYEYDAELIAQQPLEQRDASRLLLRKSDGSLVDSLVSALSEHIPEQSLFLFNNTKVFPSRIFAKLPSGGKVEIFLLRNYRNSSTESYWEILAKPFRKLSKGLQINFADGVSGYIVEEYRQLIQPHAKLCFQCSSTELEIWLSQCGYIPLPPYIRRQNPQPASKSSDRERYQTVYAQESGSVAAPTAGLHFTDSLIKKLEDKGCVMAPVTLHVGGGTFLPVKTEDLSEHPMHEETFLVPAATYELWQSAKQEGRSIIAIGTTSLRCMESFLLAKAKADEWMQTRLFLYPKSQDDRYRPQACDALLTNFHQPESTLLMLVAALIGYDEMRRMYRHAVKQRYRLFSYGDASLLWL